MNVHVHNLLEIYLQNNTPIHYELCMYFLLNHHVTTNIKIDNKKKKSTKVISFLKAMTRLHEPYFARIMILKS